MKWRNWRTDNAEALLSGNPADVYHTTVCVQARLGGGSARTRPHAHRSPSPLSLSFKPLSPTPTYPWLQRPVEH
jgi:hypothetical protein